MQSGRPLLFEFAVASTMVWTVSTFRPFYGRGIQTHHPRNKLANSVPVHPFPRKAQPCSGELPPRLMMRYTLRDRLRPRFGQINVPISWSVFLV